MACANCGKTTEKDVYICSDCLDEAIAQHHLGASLAMCPSVLNDLALSGSFILSMGKTKKGGFLEFFDTQSLKVRLPDFKLETEEAPEDEAEKLVEVYERILINMGLPLDLEA
ncbi:MAG: hypothetical protein JSW28_01595, partial [Thermoplasmata archaeon]